MEEEIEEAELMEEEILRAEAWFNQTGTNL
jgi:hypothetical protein